MELCQKGVQPQPKARGDMPDVPECTGCAGRAQASTDGGRRAPFALGDDDERVTRGLRIESLAAAAACAFFPRELVAA